MRISDWSSDVCSSDLRHLERHADRRLAALDQIEVDPERPWIEIGRDQIGIAVDGYRQPPLKGQGGRQRGAFVIVHVDNRAAGMADEQIGRASCRERVCQYV